MEVYANASAIQDAATNELEETGMRAGEVYRMVSDELLLDGLPLQNLASFVTTYMEPEAVKLMEKGARINIIDMDEYPRCADIHQRCVNMIGNLWKGKPTEKGNYCGTATVGSSEAIMLAGLAMRHNWRARRKASGLSIEKPNMVFGSNVQCCWHKMCLYFDIEAREADVSPDCLVLTAERAKPLIDENTIGVCAILGSTFNGEFENVKEIHDMVVQVNKENNWDVPIHVDAASGGFIAPFISPELVWDFQLPQVKSINASGHKFGLVFAGIGWLMFRERSDLPDELVIHVNYLGGDQSSFTLNFSKPASTILGQYYQFLRLGKEGYRNIQSNGMANAEYIRQELVATGAVRVVDKAHMPLVAFCLTPEYDNYCTVFDLQDHLKARGWIVPAYTCPKGATEFAIMRVVVKQNMSRNVSRLFVTDFKAALQHFKAHPVVANVEKPVAQKHSLTFAQIAHLKMVGHDLHHRASGDATTGVC